MHSTSMGDLGAQIERALLCFSCRGVLAWRDEQLECQSCAARFALVGENLIDHRPMQRPDNAPTAGVSGRYGKWFKEGAATYEQRHGLTDAYSNWVAAKARGPLGRHTELPARFVLEIGCGTGVHTRGWLHQGLAQFILAVDTSPQMVAEATKGTPPGRAVFSVRDVHDLNLASDSVDVVAGGAILHHLLDVRFCLREIRRVLKPGGAALFMEPFYPANRMLGFMLRLLLGQLRRRGRQKQSKLDTFDALVDSWTRDVEQRHQQRNDLARLALRDDKHLFIRDEMRQLGQEVGFRSVEIESVHKDYGAGSENVMRDIALDILASLAKERNIDPLEIHPTELTDLEAFSYTYAEFFLDEYGPQEFCIFVK